MHGVHDVSLGCHGVMAYAGAYFLNKHVVLHRQASMKNQTFVHTQTAWVIHEQHAWTVFISSMHRLP